MAGGTEAKDGRVKIVFFGSGMFALTLAQRIHGDYTVAGVTTTKPKPRGRGRKLVPPKIITWAQENGIPVFTPDDPNTSEFIETLSSMHPDLYVLASYGHILGSQLLAIPQYGGMNVHPSLLPRYRGAAPIQRALMTGEKKTGVSMILMDEKIDHGDVIFQQAVVIGPDDTYGVLLDRLSAVAVENIGMVIQDVLKGTCQRIPQDHTQRSYARKISKEETMIKWERGIEAVHNHIRALSPHPAARTMFRGNELKIIEVHKSVKICKPGEVCFDQKNVAVGTGDGSVILDKVRPASKALMGGHDFMNGYHIKEGEVML
jgi:methionyl-tRNA formyltransferase